MSENPIATRVRESLSAVYELIDSAQAVHDPELAADLQRQVDQALAAAVTGNELRKRSRDCTH